MGFSPRIDDSRIIESLSRLNHYEQLNRCVSALEGLEQQIDNWLKQVGQSSPGSIAIFVKQSIRPVRKFAGLFQTGLAGYFS
jgi:hypothetical protein